MLKIKVKCNTALITKSPLLNKNIGKLLFENLQTKLVYSAIHFCVYMYTIFNYFLSNFFGIKTDITLYIL